MANNALIAERNRLAKMLNQRMLRLEKAGIDFGAITKYKDWIEEYYGISKTGKLRFPEKRTAKSAEKWNVNVSLRRELDILNYFATGAGWKTSTVSGAKDVVRKRREKFEFMGLKFPSDEVMNEFLKSESWQALKKIYGSSLAIRLVGKKRFSAGSKNRRSTVKVMDDRLQKFMKRLGNGYDLRNLGIEDIEKIFGLDSEDIIEAIDEDEVL